MRKRVFVDKLNYQVHHTNLWEWDQYDTPNAVYLIVEYQGQVVSSCRLVPTTGPYMIRDVFPDMYEGVLPVHRNVWEVTRTFVRPGLSSELREKCFAKILAAKQVFGLQNNISFMLGLMPKRLITRMVSSKFAEVKMHKTRNIDGFPTSVAEFKICKRIYENLQKKIKEAERVSLSSSKHYIQ